ncbi:thymidine phosphorylase [Salinifilum aidingensis]
MTQLEGTATRTEQFTAVDVVRAKRDGEELDDARIAWVIRGYLDGRVTEGQMAALLMAVVFRGMTERETASWTAAMLGSGQRLDWSDLDVVTADKHSTGGVGDTTTLVLTPLLAACGAAVPQLSGRGLGSTGGTLDKFEAIPGWCAELSTAAVRERMADPGAVVCAASGQLAPADRALYALRDVTGTVESVPLIASSIMSKKLAEGTGALVLDVKCGSGAFVRDREQAAELARAAIAIGRAHGVRTSALITDMSRPLGTDVGNALEVAEAVRTLRGQGADDLVELTLALARELLAHAGITDADPEHVLASGQAHERWRRLVRAQGGDPDAPLPEAEHVEAVSAPRAGTLARLDAAAVGEAAWRLGAGRARQDDAVDPAAGVRCLVKPGEPVEAGQVVCELHTNRPELLPAARRCVAAGIDVSAEEVAPGPLVLAREPA